MFGEMSAAIRSGKENDVYYELRRVLISIAYADEKYADLEKVANDLYDYLTEQKKIKDDYINSWK